MNYAILINLITDFKYVQILITQSPKQTSYLKSSKFDDQFGYIICQIWNSKSAILIGLKIRADFIFIKKKKEKKFEF
jgi:hypothetical protein